VSLKNRVLQLYIPTPATSYARTLRRYMMGSSWTRRLDCFSIIFLSASFFSAGLLQLLYYSAGREDMLTHRLSTAASLYFIAIVISALCSLTVIEASGINDLVPEIRTWLKRETFALAAQLAHLAHVEAQEMQVVQEVMCVGEGASKLGDGGRVSSVVTAPAPNIGSGESSTVAAGRERVRLRSAFCLIECAEQYIHHEEEQSDPVQVFYKVHASTAAITVTVSSLVTMLLVAGQRLYTMLVEGWSYGGDMGEFVRILKVTR